MPLEEEIERAKVNLKASMLMGLINNKNKFININLLYFSSKSCEFILSYFYYFYQQYFDKRT